MAERHLCFCRDRLLNVLESCNGPAIASALVLVMFKGASQGSQCFLYLFLEIHYSIAFVMKENAKVATSLTVVIILYNN